MTHVQNKQHAEPDTATSSVDQLGLVLIGRNEGSRLRPAVQAALNSGAAVVYIDSASSDGSAATARELGAHVVELDASQPLSAARGRNAGFAYLRQLQPDTELVQFIDGDCVLAQGWLDRAMGALSNDAELALVCGRLYETNRQASIYNRLCDLEWDEPAGPITSSGGIFMIRAKAFDEVAGFREDMIAGEEPELCVRLRRQGWKLRRLDAEMAWHDAAMTRFGQWWKRAMRAGHAFAEGAWLHGRSPQRHWVREARSNGFWGLVLPTLAVLGAWPSWGLSLLLLGGYPVLGVRIYRHQRSVGRSRADARLYALFCVLSKFPSALGQMRFHWNRLRGRRPGLIEYKGKQAASRERSQAAEPIGK